jgi:hypothetical protein
MASCIKAQSVVLQEDLTTIEQTLQSTTQHSMTSSMATKLSWRKISRPFADPA